MSKDSPSGLWHQRQRSGQPLKKTVVRMPGPSLTLISLMSKMIPAVIQASFSG
jgi:hypothetical protein